jgi:hypothetical protein
MIVGSLITVYRLIFERVAEADPWHKIRSNFMQKYEAWPVLVQVIAFLVISFVAIPTAIADYALFTYKVLTKRKYNTPKVKEDVVKYIYFGLLYGEAVSYSSYNRFNEKETADIELVFKEAEQRIINHGFEPFTVGQFVEAYQEQKPLPRLRIKGQDYPEGT